MASPQESSVRGHLLAAASAGLLLAACSSPSSDGSSLVIDKTSYNELPANISGITLALPEEPAQPWCLLSDGALVVWPQGSTNDATAGEVRNRSGTVLGRIGETVEGGGAVEESPSSKTLDDVDWAGCTPTDPVLHQFG